MSFAPPNSTPPEGGAITSIAPTAALGPTSEHPARPATLVQLTTPRTKKAFVRAPPDRTQRWRRAFQLAFLLLNVVIGVQFWAFVRHFETGGETAYVARPPGVEGWLPIAALMNLKATLLTGELPSRFPAGMVLLVAFLATTFLFRKAFCAWLCPVGTVSEGLWKLGRRIFGRTFPLPRWADWPLRALKYVLLGFFLWAVAGMSVVTIHAFLASPYGLVADVKMLDFFRHLGTAAAIVVAVLVLASVLVPNLWCPTSARTARSTGSCRGGRRCASGATPTRASTAGSARRRARRASRWT